MTQPQLMHQIADAMERNPEGWWEDIQHLDNTDMWFDSHSPVDVFEAICDERAVRFKPRTYTLHVAEMPEPLREEPGMREPYYVLSLANEAFSRTVWTGTNADMARLRQGRCYPDEPTAREAWEMLTKAMGG